MGFYDDEGRVASQKILTGTTGTTSSTIPHSLTASDILSIDVVVEDSTGAFISPVYNGNTADLSHYAMNWDSTNILLTAQGSQIDVRPYKILINYTN